VTLKEIRANYEEYERVLKRRYLPGYLSTLKKLKELDDSWREDLKKLNELRRKKNELSRRIAKGERGLLTKSKKVSSEIERLNEKVRKTEKEMWKCLKLLPNWLDERVPIGPDESYSEPVRYWGRPKVWKEHLKEFERQTKGKVKYELIDWEPLHHYDLVREFNLVEMEKASEIAGSRFYFEKGELVFLDLTLSLYAVDFFRKKGFDNILITSYMMRRKVEERIAHMDTFIDALYSTKEDELVLIPSSEHPICALYKDCTFRERELPLRIVAWSPAFRREAGAHGKDTKGIFRTHQFHKVELHSITTLDEDKEELEFMVGVVEEFMQSLRIPYRVVILPSGDMDKRALIQYDIEGWFPRQGRYRELGSYATMGCWVSEKINTKVDRKGKREFVANLYGTGCAIQRTLLAMLVNNHDPKRQTIKLPKALTKYMGFREIRKEE